MHAPASSLPKAVITQLCNRVIRLSPVAGFQSIRRVALVYSPKHIVLNTVELLPTLSGYKLDTAQDVRAIIILPMIGIDRLLTATRSPFRYK